MILSLLAVAVLAQNSMPGQRYAVVIGINSYKEASIAQLNGAVNDADRFASALVKYGEVPKDHVLELTSSSPIKPTRKVFEEIGLAVGSWKPRPNDTLFIFYAGHGVDVSGVPYLLPYDAAMQADQIIGALLTQVGTNPSADAQPGTPSNAAPPSPILIQELLPTDPKQLGWMPTNEFVAATCARFGTVIAFFDMCRGQAWDSGPIAANPALTTTVLNSIDPGKLPPGVAPSNWAILQSCGRGQSSAETADGKGGVFTTTLIKALTTNVASEGASHEITYGDVEAYVKREVAAESHNTQKPQSNLSGDPQSVVIVSGTPKTSQKDEIKPLEQQGQLFEPKTICAQGNYSILPSPRYCDIVSGEGGFEIKIPAEGITDPAAVRRIQKPVQTPDGTTQGICYTFERQTGYAYYKYSATYIDYPKQIDKQKILEFGQKLVGDKKSDWFGDLFGTDQSAVDIVSSLINVSLNVNIGNLGNLSSVGGNSILSKIPLIGGLLGHKSDSGVAKTGYPYPIGQNPGYRVEWRKPNSGFGIMQLGVFRNRLMILSEIFAGPDLRLPDGIVPRYFVDSLNPFDELLDHPDDVIPVIGGGAS